MEKSLNEKEIRTPMKAIRNFCKECLGTYEEIKICTAYKCPLYDFRMGKNPFRVKTILSEDQKQVLRDRMTKIRQEKAKTIS